MSIQKNIRVNKSGKSVAKYYACVWDSSAGRSRWSAGFDKRADAVRAEGKLIEATERGIAISSGSLKFSELADMMIEATRSDYAEATWEVYKGFPKCYLKPAFGKQQVSKIKPISIMRFKNEQLMQYSPTTVNKMLNLLSKIFQFAMSPLHAINYNPVEGIKRDKEVPKPKITWTEETIGYFFSLSSVRSSPCFDMIALQFAAGARPGEGIPRAYTRTQQVS